MEKLQGSDILKGKTIICTYPQREKDDFFKITTSLGATVISMPMINISAIPFKLKNNIEEYQWLIFTSKNAVPAFLNQYQPRFIKIAAIGESTADVLQQAGYSPNYIGSGQSADNFADEIDSLLKPEEKIILALGTLAPDTLQNILSPKNKIERVDVYQTTMPNKINTETLKLVYENRYDVLIISSPSAIKNLMKHLRNPLPQLRIISIGQTTTAAIRSYKIEPLATSDDSSYRGLAETTIDYLKKHNEITKS